LRPMVIEYFHSSTLSAHLGMAKTLSRIQKVFYWPDMKSEVCDFVRRCQDCQRAKPAQNSRVGLHSSEVVTRRLERIFIDFFGPIVRSRKGNMVKDCLVERVFPCFGVPQSIVSDNAAVFKSRIFYNLCFSWVIKHITSSPYYPQASQVERFNRNLKTALVIYHNSQHTRWDEHLPSLAMASTQLGTSRLLRFLPRYFWADS
jgi:hypothetical protein